MAVREESLADWLDASKCAEILRQERWADGIVRCPYCDSSEVVVLEVYQEVFHRYQCKSCSDTHGKKKTFNDKTKTMYEGSTLPLTHWFYAKSLILNKVSDLELSKELQVDYNTARRMSTLIRANIFFDQDESTHPIR